jgi:hypothetical protein
MLFARPRPLQVTTFHLRALIDDGVAFLKRDESLRTIEVTIDGQDALLKADAELIRATVVNLLLNAAQAMAGQGRIAIQLARSPEGATIEIHDSGPGIPPEVRAQVFEPFFTTKARGGGLGLPIARRTAERHGGNLTLACPPEGGTVATLTLPSAGGAGAALTVTETTRNIGGGNALASSTRYYLSVNGLLDAGDVLLGTRAVPALAAGESSSATVTLTLPETTATGAYFVLAVADGDGAVAEVAENNNVLLRAVNVGPDLGMWTLGAPNDALAGQSITITDTTRNAGAGAAGVSTTTFYLSTDWTLDAADVAARAGGRTIVVTRKEAVKLRDLAALREADLLFATQRLEIESGAELLEEALARFETT